MIVAGSHYSLRDARLEGRVVQTIRDWATRFPQDLIALDEKVRKYRDGLYHPKGISENMMHKAEIPVRLFWMIGKAVGSNDWMDDRKVWNMFLRHFKVGCVNKTSELQRGW